MKALQVRRSCRRGSGWRGWRRRWRRRRRCGSGRWSTSTSTRRSCRARAGTGCTPRLAGICGSDLSMIEGHASTYFDDWVSFPFVPGHEVVGELDDGTRVVLEPVLGHEARGFRAAVRRRRTRRRRRLRPPRHRPLDAGIQTGFCCSTGGGWSPQFVAHDSQLHRIGDDMPDERAVLVEPLAGGIHAALKAADRRRRRRRSSPCSAPARWASPRSPASSATCRRRPSSSAPATPTSSARPAAWAPHEVVPAAELARAIRRIVGCHVVGDHLSSGAHATIDAVGTRALDRRRPRHHPAPRPGRDDGHAGRGHPRPDRAVAPRDRARRRLHVRHRAATAARRSTSPWRPPTPSRRNAGSRPPTPSPTTSTPSPTPPRRAGAAPSRSPST